MQFEISPIQLVTICAVINGFVFAFLLFEKKENRKANRFLSLMIFCMCLTFTPYMLDTSIWHTHRWLAWLPFSLSYWIGPAFYFYIKTLTNAGFEFKTKDLWHFSPIILNYIHSIYHGLTGERNPWIWFHYFSEYLESMAIVSIVIYMMISYRKIVTYQRSLLDNVSNTEEIDLRWIRRLIIVVVFSFVLILVFLTISSGISGKYNLDKWDGSRSMILLIYAGILYWISISGFKQTQTLRISTSNVLPPSSEDSSQNSEVIQRLKDVIETQKLYTNSELGLMDLSKTVEISPRAISDAINQELGKNYYQFINEYRVQEMKEKLKDSSLTHLKIFSLAVDSGFNSKASFNRVFKTYTGYTPKEFRSQNS